MPPLRDGMFSPYDSDDGSVVSHDYVFPYGERSIEKYHHIWRYLQSKTSIDLETVRSLKRMFETVADMLPEATARGDGGAIVDWLKSQPKPKDYREILCWLREEDAFREASVHKGLLEHTCYSMDDYRIRQRWPRDVKTAAKHLEDCCVYRFLCELEYIASPDGLDRDVEAKRVAMAQAVHSSSNMTARAGAWNMSSLDPCVMETIAGMAELDGVPDWFRRG